MTTDFKQREYRGSQETLFVLPLKLQLSNLLYISLMCWSLLISSWFDVTNSQGDMAHRVESNNTEKLLWTPPGSCTWRQAPPVHSNSQKPRSPQPTFQHQREWDLWVLDHYLPPQQKNVKGKILPILLRCHLTAKATGERGCHVTGLGCSQQNLN